MQLGRKAGGHLILGCTALVLVFVGEAHAYGDPGTGVLLWQMLLAAFFGASFFFRRFLTWLRLTFKGKKTDTQVSED